MKIRGKTLIIIGVTVICLIGLLHVVATTVITNTVARLEEQATSQNVDRFVGALSHELDNLNSTARDYASWDDTYAFVQDNNTDYIDSNIVESTFINLRLHFILFVNSTGQIVFGKALDLKAKMEMPIPESMMEDVSAHDLLWHHETTESSIAGMIFLPEGPMLVASRPILTSQGQGPIQGALIMGRFLDSAEMEYLNATVHLPMTAQVLGDPWLSPDFQEANASLTQGASFSVQAISADTIAGYAMLKDIYGDPILIFRVDAPEPIFAQGQATLNMFILLATLVGLVCAIVTVALLERFVLSRLSRVSKDVRDIGEKGDSTARVSVTGKDELSDLSSEINNMLSRLAQTEGKLKEERDRAQKYLDIAGVMIVALDANGKVALLNRKGCDILECNVEEALGKNWFDTYLPSETKDQVSKIFRALMNGEVVAGTHLEYNENPVLTRSGKERLIAWHNTVIKDSDGIIVGTLSSGIDVTEQKEADEALCGGELRFRRITENMQDMVSQTDMAGIFQYLSPSTKRVLGYEAENLRGKSLFDFVHPDDIDRVTKAIEKSVSDHSWGRIEFRYKHADGHYLWLETVGNFLLDDKGKPVGTVFNSRDITKRKQLETELQHTTKRLQILLETATEGIITADPEENITFANKAFAEIVGYGENELLNLNARKFLDEEGIKKIEEETQVRKTGGTSRYELSMYHKNGEPRIVQLSASPLWNEDGTYAGSLGIVTDVTERKRMEEALLESQQKFERLFNNNPEAAAFVDVNDRVLEINPRFTEVFGYSSEETKEKLLDDLIVPEDKKEEAKTLTKESMSGYIFRETIRRNKGGSLVPVLISAASITIGNRLTGYVVSYRDITERKNMEERLQESEERFRGIAERSFDATATVDMKGTITYASPSVEKVLGYPQNEVMGKPFLEYFSPAKLSDATQLFTDLLQGKNLEGLQLELSKTDGTMATVEINASPIIMNGEVTGIQAVFRDITQRKKMEEALRESEEKLRHTLESSPDAIILTDLVGHIIDCNQATLDMYGFSTKEEAVGKAGFQFISARDIEKAMASMKTILEKGSARNIEYTLLNKNGKEFLVDVSASVIRDASGEPKYIVAITRDITERKHMEERIRESEERLRQFIEFAPDAIYVNDLNGIFLDGNKQAETVTGYRKEELVGKSMVEVGLLPEEYAPKAVELLQKNTSGQRTGPDEMELIRKAGNRIWVEISSIPVKRGDKTEVLGIARDITERKRMENALRESEEKIRNILQSSPDAIAVTDLNGTMIDCNQEALRLAGVSTKEELLGKNTFDLISPRDYEKSMKNMEILLERGTIRDFEFTLVAKDGREFPAEVSMSLMRDPIGEPKYFVATIKNITERKEMLRKLEEYSQQLEKMVEKRTKQLKEAQEQLVKTERLAAIGQVAAMVGHDLRNPLTGIKGAAYYLKTKPALKTDKKTMEMLELIEKDIEYSNKIITDLLEYSREVHLELTETTPRSIVSETLSLLEVPKNVEIINLTQDEPRTKVDIEKLNRVFVNLIKNAFDAMPKGGKLTIKSIRTNDNVELAFTDTGMGMTKEQMGKIWTPFFTTKAKGMGLGLPICKRIVEAHRGHISVQSMAGLGTTFTVTIPIEPKITDGGEKIWMNIPESLSSTTMKPLEQS